MEGQRLDFIDKQKLKDILKAAGAVAVGIAEAGSVPEEIFVRFRDWSLSDKIAGMSYMRNYPELRSDPRGLLDGARSIICTAFSFAPCERRSDAFPVVACYAYGKDYHDVLRNRLRHAVEALRGLYGGDYRICIDSAPILERCWAMLSGIGRLGDNGAVIVDGYGSMVFLAEIVTTLQIEPDTPSVSECLHCGLCRRSCPGNAIGEDGLIDAARCISYQTIEHKGDWVRPGEGTMFVMDTAAGRRSLFGCDICLRVCPYNRDIPSTDIPEFAPSPELLTLTRDRAAAMTQQDFSRIFSGSPVKHCRYSGFVRNVSNLK